MVINSDVNIVYNKASNKCKYFYLKKPRVFILLSRKLSLVMALAENTFLILSTCITYCQPVVWEMVELILSRVTSNSRSGNTDNFTLIITYVLCSESARWFIA